MDPSVVLGESVYVWDYYKGVGVGPVGVDGG